MQIWISSILYVVFLVYVSITPGSKTFHFSEKVTLPWRFLFALIVFPLIGLACWLLGFIGMFMLQPFVATLHLMT